MKDTPPRKYIMPQFLGGPRDGESAATAETTTVHHTQRGYQSVHLYIRRVDGHYDYAGIREDQEDDS